MNTEPKELQAKEEHKFVSEELCRKAIATTENWIGEGYTPAQVLSSLEVARSLVLLAFAGRL